MTDAAAHPSAPASLLRRIGAFAIDYLALSIWIVIISIVFAVLPRGLVETLFATPLSGQLTVIAILTLPVLLYFALQEASARQGTIGKRLLRLRVTDGAGRRLSLPRSIGRSALKLAPWEIAHTALWRTPGWPSEPESPTGLSLVLIILCWTLIAGYIASALISRSRRTLYDRAAGTMVVRAG